MSTPGAFHFQSVMNLANKVCVKFENFTGNYMNQMKGEIWYLLPE